MKRTAAAACAAACFWFATQAGSSAQQPGGLGPSPAPIAIQATTVADLRTWDAFVADAARSGGLRVRSVERDPALPARTIERFEQFHQGVRIWGAEIVRDSERGVPLSIFGVLSPELTLSVEPSLTPGAARDALLQLAGTDSSLLAAPALVVLRLDNGDHRLAYTGVVSGSGDVSRVFIDAQTGAELMRYTEIQRQAAVGTGTGVLGDRKKLSVTQEAGAFFADDKHRPPVLRTFDMRGNSSRAVNVINGSALNVSERATDTDNLWTDPSAVDGHVHIGWTYDYYYKRHARRGLDGQDRPITTLINGVTPEGALSLPPSLLVLAVNAFWCGPCGPSGAGLMYFGNGIPSNFFLSSTGQNVAPLAGSLDIAAHELSHGVIDSSSGLIAGGEPGALSEAFADIMGTSVEFFYQTSGGGRGQADYTIGEDSFRALRPGSVNGIRSLSDPQAFQQLPGSPDPDHYSRRYTGMLDDGGVHINAGIPGHAFYLAVEGGTNRTSGLSVQGVGAANREQIEKVFYRAFTLLMPASSTFSTARAATIQAARDLYGVGSAVERAVTQAWTAVGLS